MTEKHQTPGSSRSPSMSHQQHELAHNVAADPPQRHLMQQNRPGKANTQNKTFDTREATGLNVVFRNINAEFGVLSAIGEAPLSCSPNMFENHH